MRGWGRKEAEIARRIAATLIGAAALLGLAAAAIWAIRERRHPAASPFGQRLFLDLPRPFLSRQLVRTSLEPAPGERVLEVGPGTGYYSLEIARALAPGGRLDVLDIQQPMLDELMRRAVERGVGNIVPTRGDARALPYPDATFDAALLVATLGEIPDRRQALRELRRVLKPSGRLVVGEGQPDPHMIPLDELQAEAEAAGLRYQHHTGGRLGYLVRFHAA